MFPSPLCWEWRRRSLFRASLIVSAFANSSKDPEETAALPCRTYLTVSCAKGSTGGRIEYLSRWTDTSSAEHDCEMQSALLQQGARGTTSPPCSL
jgi:hypothetical protein